MCLSFSFLTLPIYVWNYFTNFKAGHYAGVTFRETVPSLTLDMGKKTVSVLAK